MRVLASGVMHDLAQLARDGGRRWDTEKIARAERLLQGADGYEAASYLTSLYRDPRTAFDGDAKQKLHDLLVRKLDVDEAELKSFKVPEAIALEYINPEQNAKKFYGLEVRGTTLIISNGRIGTKGVKHERRFASEGDAVKEYQRRLREKLREGYVRPSIVPKPIELTFQDGSSNKFYRLEVEGSALAIRYGRIGSEGQVHKKSFATQTAAVREYNARLKDKLREGYLAPAGTVAPANLPARNPIAVAPATRVAAPSGEDSPYPRVKTMADWNALSIEQQEEVLDDMEYWPQRYPHVRSTEAKGAENLADRKHREFANKMIDDVGDLEVDSDYHATVGPTEITIAVFTLETGEIIGGKLDYYQNGADNDEAGGHFDTEEEAEAAGCEFSDVNWQAHAMFNHKLEELGDKPYYLEWSGY